MSHAKIHFIINGSNSYNQYDNHIPNSLLNVFFFSSGGFFSSGFFSSTGGGTTVLGGGLFSNGFTGGCPEFVPKKFLKSLLGLLTGPLLLGWNATGAGIGFGSFLT